MADFQIAKLQQVLARIDRQVDAAGEAFRGQSDAASARARSGINRILRQRTGEKGQMLRRPTVTATATGQAIDAFRNVNDRAISSLALIADEAGRVLAASGHQGQSDPSLVRSVARVLETELSDRLDKLESDVLGILQRGQAVGQAVDEVSTEAHEAIDAYVTYSRSAYETALMTFAQALVTTGTDPVDAYLYLGPIDSRIRPFCLKTVGKVWSRERIDRMDNGITPNTFLRRGGPNCRHLWVPAPASVLSLVDTGQVVNAGILDDVAFAAKGIGGPIRRTA